MVLGRSLMIGWRTNSWNPEGVSTVVAFVCVCLSVCLSVYTRATEHSFWPRNLIFGLSDPWTFFFVFRNFHFYAFYRHFSIFSLYNTSKFFRLSVCPRATGHTFWSRNLIFGLSDPWDMRKKTHFFVFPNFHFYAFYRHFSIFSLYNTSKFLVWSSRSQFLS